MPFVACIGPMVTTSTSIAPRTWCNFLRTTARSCFCPASTAGMKACDVSMALGFSISLPRASMDLCTGFCSITSRCRTSLPLPPDRQTAKGRFRGLLMGGSHESREFKPEGLPLQFLEAGIYENDYVREQGIWKIKRLDYMMQWQADYERGWSRTVAHLQPASRPSPKIRLGPTCCCRPLACGRPGRIARTCPCILRTLALAPHWRRKADPFLCIDEEPDRSMPAVWRIPVRP